MARDTDIRKMRSVLLLLQKNEFNVNKTAKQAKVTRQSIDRWLASPEGCAILHIPYKPKVPNTKQLDQIAEKLPVIEDSKAPDPVTPESLPAVITTPAFLPAEVEERRSPFEKKLYDAKTLLVDKINELIPSIELSSARSLRLADVIGELSRAAKIMAEIDILEQTKGVTDDVQSDAEKFIFKIYNKIKVKNQQIIINNEQSGAIPRDCPEPPGN